MEYRNVKLRGAFTEGVLLASAIIALLSLMSFLVVPVMQEPLADMRVEPVRGGVKLNETFVVRVMVHASTPVNVFKGEIRFDPTILAVDAIDYNTSIADLWAEKPWYENGAGTLNFIGGTTIRGGFLGSGALLTITFRAHAPGDAIVHMEEARILAHDGLGTDVVLKEPIDSIFSVDQATLGAQTVAEPESTTATIEVVEELPSTDLNHDGKQTIADVSIFMMGMLGEDPALDLNLDGEVNAKDLSIIMSAK